MDEARLSVWATAQLPAAHQRSGRYVPATTEHPAKMLPAIAAHAIAAYTQPGDLVLDPMCGIGTSLVEAVRSGRHGLGVEYEARWAGIARANLALARGAEQPGHPHGRGRVYTGDARHLLDLVDPALAGTCALVLTSPPYGSITHGQVRNDDTGVTKYAHRYSNQRRAANLSTQTPEELRDSLTQILTACTHLLRPGGIVAITARPWRHHGDLVDLPADITRAALDAGLVPHERLVALLAGIRDGRFVSRTSFFRILQVRSAQARGIPLLAIAHEDLLVYRAPRTARPNDQPPPSRGSS